MRDTGGVGFVEDVIDLGSPECAWLFPAITAGRYGIEWMCWFSGDKRRFPIPFSLLFVTSSGMMHVDVRRKPSVVC